MILVLIAGLAIVGLLVLYRSTANGKIKLMSYVIIVLVVVNFLNELVGSMRYVNSFTQIQDVKSYRLSSELYKLPQSATLLKEQQQVVDYLTQKMRVGEHVVVTIRNLHPERFKMVFGQFQRQHNNVLALSLTHREDGQIDRYSLRKIINENPKYFIYLIVDGYVQFNQMTILKSLYETCAVTIIFKVLPEGFMRHSIAQYAQIVEVHESYFMSPLYKNYPVNVITLCSKYVPINYNFYMRAQSQPLSELCCGALPSSPVTECVRDFMTNELEFVEISRIRHCLSKGSTEGLLLQNGLARVKKEYYWAGRCDIGQFAHQTPGSQML